MFYFIGGNPLICGLQVLDGIREITLRVPLTSINHVFLMLQVDHSCEISQLTLPRFGSVDA